MRDRCTNCYCPQPQPNHALGSEWLIHGKQCLGVPTGPGDLQGQISHCLMFEQSHTQCVRDAPECRVQTVQLICSSLHFGTRLPLEQSAKRNVLMI